MRLLLGGTCCVALAAVALYVPVPPAPGCAVVSPEHAAKRAEREVPLLGLVWGRVRGWERVGDGWTVLWQPSHGMWLISAWAPDGSGDVRWRVDAASWLPGSRLGRNAAEALVERETPVVQARDWVGRRDWLIGDSRLLGALPAGGELPSRETSRRPPLEAVLAGLLLAGAVSRHLVPGVSDRGWRRVVGGAALLLVAALPQLAVLSPGSFRAGVRPWVAELSFGAAAFLVLGAVAFAALRFPALGTAVPAAWLPVALAVGVLAGRVEPGAWLAGTADISPPVPVWACLAVLSGWLAAFAGDGLREMLRWAAAARLLGLSALGIAGVLFGGPWLGVTLAVVTSAAVERGWGTWVGVAVMWGWVFGGLWETARWDAALRQDLAFLLLGCVVIGAAQLVRAHRAGAGEAPARS